MTVHFSGSCELVTHLPVTYSICQFGRVSLRQLYLSSGATPFSSGVTPFYLGVTPFSEVRAIFSFLTRQISAQYGPISLGPSVEVSKSSSSLSLKEPLWPSQRVSHQLFPQLMLFWLVGSCSFCSQQDPCPYPRPYLALCDTAHRQN